METKELKGKADNDLVKVLEEKRNELRDFVFSAAGSKIKNVKAGRTLRKDIARILTEINLRGK